MYNSYKKQTGFTLLELMVAIAILAVIISMIYPAYTGTYRNIDVAETQAEIYDMARTTMIRIVEDLESVYIPKELINNQQNENAESFIGQNDFFDGRRADRMRFFSRSHIDISRSLNKGGNAKIAYYPLFKEDETISLYRSDTPENIEWPEEYTDGWIICEGLYSISFTYRDKNGDTFDVWDGFSANSTLKIPSIINIKLEFINREDPDKPITFYTAVAVPLAD